MSLQSLFPCFFLHFLISSVTTQAGNVQTVAVGQIGVTFTPDTITAPVGSVVQFEFYPRNHSVTQGDFDNPCQPTAGGTGFFSGYQVVNSGVAPQVFSVTVNDTNPIFFYCSQPIYTHCQAGMVGVINPSTAGDPPQSLEEYRAAAAKTNNSSSPAQGQGGVYGAPAPNSTSSVQASAGGMPTSSSSASINTNLIGVTLGPAGAAPTVATASGYIGANTSGSGSANPTSTVSYGGPSACAASSASGTRRK